jgi:hypothetical protein
MAKAKKINPIMVQRYLRGINYPVKKAGLIDKAKDNDAPKEIVAVLDKLPNKDYKNPAEVSKGMGGVT